MTRFYRKNDINKAMFWRIIHIRYAERKFQGSDIVKKIVFQMLRNKANA